MEEDIKDLMQTRAYTDRYHPLYEEVNKIVTQGFEDLYPDDDRNKNPQNYYIWRTKGDNKVRSQHSERNGKVFCWNNPPKGGHPGEEYGCRCTAEPYTPNNDTALIEKHLIRLQKEENALEYPYKDSKGIITVGIGINANKYNVFYSLPWQDKNGNQATESQIKAEYQNIQNAPTGNYAAKSYQNYTNLRLSPTQMNNQTKEHLKNDLEYIRRNVKNFDTLPKEIRDVIIDIQYNVGNINKFPKFLDAVKRKDLPTMIKESHRLDIHKERNDWSTDTLRQIRNFNY